MDNKYIIYKALKEKNSSYLKGIELFYNKKWYKNAEFIYKWHPTKN